ncbi:hypothetical protein Lesp02_61750 [Lentzea sp. NBRC 105346]|nr:hypothetical protein Lesp02_61750 [Lentzea sp. NBRC 105346]
MALGHSAGGHLAVYAAKHSAKVIGAVAQAGVLDFELHPQITKRAAELLGGMPDEVPERYAAASPARLVPIGKPVICVHGQIDEDVPVEQSTSFPGAEVHVLEGVGHMELIDVGTAAWGTCRQAVDRLVGACY